MWEETLVVSTPPKRKTGYVYEELLMWHNSGTLSFDKWVQPLESWESPATKSRINGLLEVSGLTRFLTRIRARKASKDEITRFHTVEYVDKIKEMSDKDGGDAGEVCRFGHGGYEIALLSAGGVLTAVEAVLSDPSCEGHVDNAYCLVRPPGHHAERDRGRGFCIFNNIALAALHAREIHSQRSIQQNSEGAVSLPSTPSVFKIAIVDYDVHHGNGTQQAFWEDPDTLFISIHQDSNYPVNSGAIHETGDPESAPNGIINIPLPPGSGSGAYLYAFDTVVIPALHRFQPDLILVSSGFDASYADCLAAMMLSSETFANITRQLLKAAEELCAGKIVFAHEGGYSKDYVPFCGLAVIEELCGVKTPVEDSYLPEVNSWGYQSLQNHQKAVVDAVCAMAGLRSGRCVGTSSVDAMSESDMSAAEKDVCRAISALLSSLPKDDGVMSDAYTEGGGKDGIAVDGRRRILLEASLKSLHY